MKDIGNITDELAKALRMGVKERDMWKVSTRKITSKMSPDEINEKYEVGDQRIVTESNRERLPNFVSALKSDGYMDVRPFYQRRSRWDVDRQSRLIESFIVNVPVPPIFLYERDYNSYEVMDGQQRITAISDFYANKFALSNLSLWPELNGMFYTDLPSKVKAGIDRRSLSSIVLLKESAPDDEDAILLRQEVFERLNTGGVKLDKQEVRNCLYRGDFNEMLFRLTKIDDFRFSWGMPKYSEEEELLGSRLEIHGMSFFHKMRDAEVVLRFFALRHAAEYRHGMHGFLDMYMSKAMLFGKDEINDLEALFKETIELAVKIYGELIFKPYDLKKSAWSNTSAVAYSDAVMISLSMHLSSSDTLIQKRDDIIKATQNLFEKYKDGELTGRANSKTDVLARIRIFADMIKEYV